MLNNSKNKIQNIMGGFNVQGLFGGVVGSELGYNRCKFNIECKEKCKLYYENILQIVYIYYVLGFGFNLMFFGIGMGLGLVSGKCMCVWVLWVVNLMKVIF